MRAPSSWPSAVELDEVRNVVAKMSGSDVVDVRFAVSPYRICPLGAHIDHQGGLVSAMTINRGVILGFVPSKDAEVNLRSAQFLGDVKFNMDEVQSQVALENSLRNNKDKGWENYAKGAVYALLKKEYILTKGITGFILGCHGLDSSGLSSSAAVGIAYLLALEHANNISVTTIENIEMDRLIENEYLGLKNGILDQSAILLSRFGHLICMNCETMEHELVPYPKMGGDELFNGQETFKILLAFSGLKHALASNSNYNLRVSECNEAAKVLLGFSDLNVSARLCDVDPGIYEAQKEKLEPNLSKRASHYFSENARVKEGMRFWKAGNLKGFGELISQSGQSSIDNYECGCEPMIQLYNVLRSAPGVFGARFSGAGFRGCCLSLVHPDHAESAASYVKREYEKLQPKLARPLIEQQRLILICEPGDSACIL